MELHVSVRAEDDFTKRFRRHPLVGKPEAAVRGVELLVGVAAQAEVGNLSRHVAREKNVPRSQISMDIFLRTQKHLNKDASLSGSLANELAIPPHICHAMVSSC